MLDAQTGFHGRVRTAAVRLLVDRLDLSCNFLVFLLRLVDVLLGRFRREGRRWWYSAVIKTYRIDASVASDVGAIDAVHAIHAVDTVDVPRRRG